MSRGIRALLWLGRFAWDLLSEARAERRRSKAPKPPSNVSRLDPKRAPTLRLKRKR